MKKITNNLLRILIIALFLCTNVLNVKAQERYYLDFFVTTAESEEMDLFAAEKAEDMISSLNISNSSCNAYLGTGINVYSNNEYKERIYPIYVNNRIILVLEVFKEGEHISGTCSGNYAEFFNEIKGYTTYDCPLTIYEKNGKLYATVDSVLYDLNGNIVSGENINDIFVNNHVLNVRSICEISLDQTRSNYTVCNWTTYFCSNELNISCGPITLFNIFKNMNINTYLNYGDVSDDIHNTLGFVHFGTFMNPAEVVSYLSQKGFIFGYNFTNQRMSYSDVVTMINAGRYGIGFCESTAIPSGYIDYTQHIVGIAGFSSTRSGDYAILFDPHGNPSYNNGLFSYCLSDESGMFTSNSIVYKWNKGYIDNIRG